LMATPITVTMGSTFCVRIVATGASSTSGTWRVDDVTISGMATQAGITDCSGQTTFMEDNCCPAIPAPQTKCFATCAGTCVPNGGGLAAICDPFCSTSVITWWDAPTGGNMIATGSFLDPTVEINPDTGLPYVDLDVAGNYVFYAACDCQGCPSERGAAVFTVLDCENTECDEGCTYFLVMYDQAGNGWDGASLTLSIDEAWPATEYKMTVADGHCVVHPLSVVDGGTIDVGYWVGAFETEHSYMIYNGATGEMVLNEGPLCGDEDSPTPGDQDRIKADCPECCTDSYDFTLRVHLGRFAGDNSWILTDGDGIKIIQEVPGAYEGLPETAFIDYEITLDGCEDYNMTVFDAFQGGWSGGYWEIITDDPLRGIPQDINGDGIIDHYQIAIGATTNFGATETYSWTLPCNLECPDDRIVYSGSEDCIAQFTPGTIIPDVCYPNCSHAGNGTTVTVSLPTAIPPVFGADPTTVVDVDLPAGINPLVYEVTYVDGQIIRCTSEVSVVGDANPFLICNNSINISLTNLSLYCEIQITPDMVLENPSGCDGNYIVNILDENGNPIGDIIGPDQVGQQLTYTVSYLGDPNNLCWGEILIEDKQPPRLSCVDYTIECNHPEMFNETYMETTTFNSMPMQFIIPGGTANNPSETIIDIPVACTPLGEYVYDVDVFVDITHNDLEDLQIEVISPNGDVVTLMDYQTCNDLGTTGMIATFDNTAATPVASSCSSNIPGISGGIRPEGVVTTIQQLTIGLAEFNTLIGGETYQDITGVWQLVVRDNDNTVTEGIGYGTVNAVSISIKHGFPQPVFTSDCTDVSVTLLNEMLVDLDCGQPWIGAEIMRVWQAEDAFGNTSTCTQTVSLKAPTFDDIEIPGTVTIECGDDVDTTPEITGYPSFHCFDLPPTDQTHIACDITFIYEDQILPSCGNGEKIFRTWSMYNWCTGTDKSFVQEIKVSDHTGPVVVFDNIQVESDYDNCGATIELDGTLVEDACSGVQSVTATYTLGGGAYNGNGQLVVVDITNGSNLENLPLGMTEVVITAKDGCTNGSVDTIQIEIIDNISPIAICDDELHVSLGLGTTGLIYAEDIDEGSHDNCGDVTLDIRRVGGCLGTSQWGPTAEIACCDVNEGVTIELRVTDAAGNTNICWQTLTVEDAIPPSITCPEDKTVDCDDNIHDLDIFGEATATDNCNYQISYEDNVDLDQCNIGTITRVFTASDGSDKTNDATCVQTITVNHVSDFTVTFPADATLTDCMIEDSGQPIIVGDDCELVAISSDTTIFTLVEDACFKMEITWTLINWCVYDGVSATSTPLGFPLGIPRTYLDDDGYFQYVQTVKILDNEGPEINCPGDLTFCDAGEDTDNCESLATLIIEATDACSMNQSALEYEYKIDAFNDGTIDIIGSGNDASGYYPYGTHHIKWIVEDGCGNETECGYDFTVEDCKNPTPVCLNGITIPTMNSNGCVEIWASDLLEYAFDNCTDDNTVEESVRIRELGSLSTPSANITLCCDDIPDGEAQFIDVEIWVTDEAGNTDYCVTYIGLQDNTNICGNTDSGSTATIAGQIETEDGSMVEQVMVELEGAATSAMPTDAAGGYTFPLLPTGQNYTITPGKDINPLNGVTTFDLVLISKHILGISALDTPYKLIAADANNDANITTFDVVQIRQLILFILTDFPTNTSWRFVSKDYQFPHQYNPWFQAFPEASPFSPLSQDELYADFIGIKIGDVNGSATANSLLGAEDRNTVGNLVFAIDDKELIANESYTIDFKAKDFTQVAGYQYTINFDKAVMNFENIQSGSLNITEGNFGLSMIDEGIITTSWNASEGQTVADDAVLFSITFNTKSSALLSEILSVNSRYTEAEAYTSSLELMDVALAFNTINGSTIVGGEFDLYQNRPNPFSNETTIGFSLPKATTATVTIYDVSGKILKIINGDYARGYNEITIGREDIGSTGVLYYQLDTENNTATKKMIILD